MQKIMFMIIMAVAFMQQQVHSRHLTHHVQPPVAQAPEVMSPPPPPPPPSPSPSRTYIVGDGVGWTIPYGEPDLYDVWAFNKSFIVGDVLVFNVGIVQFHSVAEVSRTAFDSCDATTITMADSHFIFPDPVSITLTRPGPHYLIGTLLTDCSWGQKLAINVTTTRSPSTFSAPPMVEHSISYADIDNMYIPPPPPPSTSSSTPSSAPSPDDVTNYAPPAAVPSSAPPPSLMTALPVALLSIAVAFLC